MAEHESQSILNEVCQLLELDIGGATPIRLAENAIWCVPGGIIVRIARIGNIDISSEEVAVARWLGKQGVSAVVPLDIDQPLEIRGRPVTLWQQLPPHREGTYLEVAKALKKLHSLEPPHFLSQMEPLAGVEQRIKSSTKLDTSKYEWMLQYSKELEARWNNRPSGLSECVVHGDAWGGNCVVDQQGISYLLDFERVALGPPEWDLVSTAIEVFDGWLSSDTYAQFCKIYGLDVSQWDGFDTLRSIRELRRTAWGVVVAESDSKWLDQVVYRIECMQGLHGPRPWKWTSIL